MPSPGKLIVISGPSGSGKSTIVQRLRELEGQRLHVAVSATTRQPRPGEIDGRDYHFLSAEEFERRRAAGEFLETAEVYAGVWYGTLRSEVAPGLAAGKWVLLEIDVRGTAAVRQHYPQAVTIFILPSSLETALVVLEQRLRKRKTESEEVLQRRLATARQELARAAEYRHLIVNDQLESAVQQVRDILHSTEESPCSTP